MKQPLQIGRIGGGGAAWWHLSAYVHSQRVQTVQLAEPDEAIVQRLCGRFGIIKHVTVDYHDLLADPKISVVDICLPPPQQEQAIGEALAAGKHVLCEAPLAATVAGGEALIAASEAAGRQLLCVLWQRFIPAHQRVPQLLGADGIGTPCFGSISVETDEPVRDAVFHAADLLGQWLGAPRAVTAVWTAEPEAALLSLEVGGKALGQVTVLRRGEDQPPVAQRRLVGPQGSVLIRDNPEDELPLLVMQGGDSMSLRVKLPPDVREFAIIATIEHLLQCLMEDKPAAVTAQEALAALRVLLAAEEAAAKGCKVTL